MLGKQIRMERIIDRNSGKIVIVPVDHGISMGPIPGLISMRDTISKISLGGATAVLMHKGMVSYGHRTSGKDIGLVVHLSAGTGLGGDPNSKVIVTTVEEALTLGADAVSIHINLGADTEPDMIRYAGEVSRKCQQWGMPLLAMVYPCGENIKDPFDVDALKICVRVATELGADLVKISYTGDIDTFHEVVRGALIPIVIAGGPKMNSDLEILQMVRDSLNAGARGVSMGRNIFQHKDIVGITAAVSCIVLQDSSIEEAAKHLNR
ncbi:MAG: 2-amino-3,7-dideoxy-D-threo-hept-6-ulosonate synthase [Methanocalculaceae archaeon]|jgi:predicted phospho-2-dehydro-3-deoxyheptonate aldolase|nr:2-amino-3,7-dideoxy-D-threo-hept-6-ulosonate synthase [Methanocalculaceae archaeon]